MHFCQNLTRQLDMAKDSISRESYLPIERQSDQPNETLEGFPRVAEDKKADG